MARSARARRASALRGWDTRRARAEDHARKHGQQAREKSEARLTPAQKGARTRAANRLEREIRSARRADAARRGWNTRRANVARDTTRPRGSRRSVVSDGPDRGSDSRSHVLRSLDQLERDYGYPEDYDYETFDVETSPDYAPKKGK